MLRCMQILGNCFGRWLRNWMVLASVASVGAILTNLSLRAVCGETLTKRPSRIQVLAEEDELWLFLEITWQVKSGFPFASPPVMGRLEERFVFRHQSHKWEDVSHTFCTRNGGVGWHSRCGRIVRLGEKFVIFEGPHFGSSEVSVFELTEKGFVPSRDANLKKTADSASTVESPFDEERFNEFASAEMESAGWQALLRNDFMFPVWDSPTHADPVEADSRFEWNGREYGLVRDLDDAGWATVSIVAGGRKTPLVRFDANWKRFTESDRKLIRELGKPRR